jgi:hypothetical protein
LGRPAVTRKPQIGRGNDRPASRWRSRISRRSNPKIGPYHRAFGDCRIGASSCRCRST